jgi:transposase
VNDYPVILKNPLVNRAYRSLAEHYRFLISPYLPAPSKHKGGVESDVKYVKRNFLPLFREAQAQRGREVPLVEQLKQKLESWNREVDEAILEKCSLLIEERVHDGPHPNCRYPWT